MISFSRISYSYLLILGSSEVENLSLYSIGSISSIAFLKALWKEGQAPGNTFSASLISPIFEISSGPQT